MARTAGKKQAPAKIEEDDDADGWDDAVVEADGKDGGDDLRLRDWRDVERFREMKDLRRLVDDDYGLEEIFHVPLKPPPRQPKNTIPARGVKGAKPAAPAPAPAPKAAQARTQAKAPPQPPKPVSKKPVAKAPAKPKAKAKAKRK
jgi:hypothetical protein